VALQRAAERRESVRPRIAAFDAQYPLCSGIDRYALPIWMTCRSWSSFDLARHVATIVQRDVCFGTG
jgi:hypothetical protein